jgi:hypothetical protein
MNDKGEDDFNSMCSETDLVRMRKCSPGIHVKNVRAPVLMLIGGKDRRVPQSQVCFVLHVRHVLFIIKIIKLLHYLCLGGLVYVFYVGHIDKIMKPLSMLKNLN